MNIFLTCASNDIILRYNWFKKIESHLLKKGHIITDPWFTDAFQNITHKIPTDNETIYKRKLNAIEKSDLIIVDSSIKSITVGHQITLAIHKSIPVLLFYNNSNNIQGIYSHWLTKIKYETLKEVLIQIDKYLLIYGNSKSKFRFQLVLNAIENDYLESEMKKSGISKTEVIRRLIAEKINK